ncbi:winged helix-turn-helix domain-containing protein [Colwelliaceae bacterium BS250]
MNIAQYQIGQCVLDCQTMCLVRNGNSCKLSAKVFELLILFLSNEQHIVSRQQAIEIIWLENEGVGKRGFTNAIWSLRKSFKELGVDEEIFLTLPKVGYELSLTVSIITQPQTNDISQPAFKRALKFKRLLAIAIVFAMLVIIVWLSYQANAPKQEQPDIALKTVFNNAAHTNITNFEGIEEHPAISHDGKRMAFQWLSEGKKGKLYIQDLENNANPLHYISMGTGSDAAPAWSHSDESLAYVQLDENNNCQVRVFHFLTKNDVFIDNDCYYLPFMRVVTWSNNNDNSLVYAKKVNDGTALFRYDFSNGDITQITFPTGNSVDFAPHWSKDNKTLAFIRTKNALQAELILQTEDLTHQLILKNKVSILDFDWDIEENNIYVNYAENGKYLLKKISLETKDEVLISDRGLPSIITYKQNSKELFLSSHLTKEYIAQIMFDSNKIVRKISSSSRDLYGRYVTGSGDIIFLSNRSENWSLWLNNKFRSVNISKELGNATVPAVSPNGKYFAVNINSHEQTDNQNALYIGNMENGHLEQISTSGLTTDNVSWSNDGNVIFFYASTEQNTGVYSLDVSSKLIKQLSTQGEHYAIEGDDGKLFVSIKNRNGIWLLDPKTQTTTLVIDDLAAYDYAAFYWQNGLLYYLHRDPQADQVIRVNADSSKSVMVSFPPNTIKKSFGISPAAGNSIIATLKLTNEADIFSVQVP